MNSTKISLGLMAKRIPNDITDLNDLPYGYCASWDFAHTPQNAPFGAGSCWSFVASGMYNHQIAIRYKYDNNSPMILTRSNYSSEWSNWG